MQQFKIGIIKKLRTDRFKELSREHVNRFSFLLHKILVTEFIIILRVDDVGLKFGEKVIKMKFKRKNYNRQFWRYR